MTSRLAKLCRHFDCPEKNDAPGWEEGVPGALIDMSGGDIPSIILRRKGQIGCIRPVTIAL